MGPPTRYLALGDSYTVGTSVTPAENFPTALSRLYEAATGRAMQIENLGVNGYTSADVVRDELPRAQPGAHDVVTVLVGVNDYVQRVALDRYRANLETIYNSLAALDLPAGRVVGVSVPDFSYTPQGAFFGRPAAIASGIRAFNRVGADVATAHGIPFVDIFDASRSAIDSPGWLAADGLHPGQAQYQA